MKQDYKIQNMLNKYKIKSMSNITNLKTIQLTNEYNILLL